jgi:hypothetical protein
MYSVVRAMEIKICDQCKHCVKLARHADATSWRCAISVETSLLTGNRALRPCEIERQRVLGCGPDGVQWVRRAV